MVHKLHRGGEKKTSRLQYKNSPEIGLPLPTLEDIFRKRCLCRATNILYDITLPSYQLFSLPPSGRRHRALKTHTSSLNSFFPRVITEHISITPNMAECEWVCAHVQCFFCFRSCTPNLVVLLVQWQWSFDSDVFCSGSQTFSAIPPLTTPTAVALLPPVWKPLL